MIDSTERIALVHDYLTQYGGAERVLLELRSMYPDAPVLTSVADLAELPEEAAGWDIRESSMARLPRRQSLPPGFVAALSEVLPRLGEIRLVVSTLSLPTRVPGRTMSGSAMKPR